jgi:gas vesicle protein
MYKILSWLIGLTLGGAVGALLIAFFVPDTAEEIRQRLSQGYQEALDVARQAQEASRIELEAQLARMQQQDTAS